MADINNVFDISGRAMAAQLVRLNTIASNLANAGNLASSEDEAYRSLKPVFETKYADEVRKNGIATAQAVDIASGETRATQHPDIARPGYPYGQKVSSWARFPELKYLSRNLIHKIKKNLANCHSCKNKS